MAQFAEDAQRVATHSPTGFGFGVADVARTQLAGNMISGNAGMQSANGISVEKLEDKKRKEALCAAKKIIAGTGGSINPNHNFGYFDPELKGVRLDSSNVTASDKGVLQINGKDATTDNLVQLQNQSNMSSIYQITSDMIEMNDYVRGETDVIPPSLMESAKAAGIENPTRNDIMGIIKDKYDTPLTQSIYSNIMSETPLKLGPLQITPITTQGFIAGKEKLPQQNMSYIPGTGPIEKNMSQISTGRMATIRGRLTNQPDSTDARTATSAAPAGFKSTPAHASVSFNQSAPVISSQPITPPGQTFSSPVQEMSLGS